MSTPFGASSASVVDATTFPLASLDVPGDGLLLLGFVQKRPSHAITLPGGWSQRLHQESTALGLGEKRWALLERYVATAAPPYADVLTTSNACGWGTIQVGLRATSGTQPTNAVKDYAEYGSTNAPTLALTLPGAPDPDHLLIAYISPSGGAGNTWSTNLSDHGWTLPDDDWHILIEVDPSTTTSESIVAYKVADGTETGPLTFGTTRHNAGALMVMLAEYAADSPVTPGVGVDWDDVDVFVPERVKEWLITRGASAELTGGSQPGSATITLINTPDDRYNPENTGGDLYGLLRDGPRVWVGINEDGTIASDAGKAVYGLHAGRITEVSVEPEAGATVAPFVTIVTADPFEWASRQKVTLADSRTRSQADLRSEVLDALGWATSTLPVEPATLPLSSADGLALRILDDLNSANGTRHFAKPEDVATDWFRYVAVRRTSGLDGSSSASLDAGSDHVTDTNGWRISADGVINQQKASVEPLWFSPLRDVWEAETPLPTVVTGTPYEVWVEFPDFVDGPVVDVASTGGTLTATLVPFGRTAKLTLTSSSTNVVTRLAIQGHIVVRGSVASVVIDDTASQADSRGVRAGPDLTGDYLGTLTSAEGFARHIVYRFAGPLYRPTVTVVNWFPYQFDLDLFDRISVTVAQLSITDRIFEIVGLTHHGEMAAADALGNPTAVLHTTTYVLQESREQTDPGWFILDDSLLDGDDILAY